MESKINYTVVGVCVVLLLAGLISFAFWLGKYGGQQEYDQYYVYFSESVAGLSTDTSVKYSGVDIGAVEHIGINPENSEQVALLLKVKHGTPIKTDTKAQLKTFGITGLVFIGLNGSSKEAPLLLPSNGSIPVISTSPSTFAQIDESLSKLAEKANIALDKFDRLLSEDNLENFSNLLSETTALARGLRKEMHGFQDFVDNGIILEKRMNKAFTKVEAASISVKKLADKLDNNYADVGLNIKQDVHHSLESFNQLLYELDILAGELQKTVRATQASPSDLLFKQSRPRPGPGEDGYHDK